ncbi:unnamed protein product [Rhizoctonia solani]|nr:unnamed protein product [Rhizoctonia solani]
MHASEELGSGQRRLTYIGRINKHVGFRETTNVLLFASLLGPNEDSISSIMDRFAPSDVPEPHYIAMYGGTGVGKSTFVNDASGTDVMPVGHDLPSCTQQVMASEIFKVDGQNIVLFDTPGFDDTTISDADTLKRIAEFLESM